MTPALALTAAATVALALMAGPALWARATAAAAPAAVLIAPHIDGRRATGAGLVLLITGLATVAVAIGPAPAVALGSLVAVGVTAGPRLALARRSRLLAAQLAAAAEVIGAGCEAGLSFQAAIGSVCRELPEPVAGELSRVRSALDLGQRVDDAVRGFGESVGTADARLFAAVVSVQRRSGGDLGRSLRALGDRMMRRQRLADELRSVTAQARSTALIVVALPLVAAIAAEFAAPGAISGLLETTAGSMIVGVSVVVQGVGLLLVRLISRVPA